MSLDRWLTAQSIIAGVGEKSRMGWWETDSHGKATSLVLSRLFPRTASWASIQLSILGAAAEHRRCVPSIPAITLFDLGEAVNRELADLLLHRKQMQEAIGLADSLMDQWSRQSGEQLVSKLVQLGLTTPQLVERVRRTAKLTDRAVWVADIAPDADRKDTEALGLLLAGYQFSTPGQFLAPYLRVVG